MTGHHVDMRAKVIEHLNAGLWVSKVAQKLGISTGYVTRVAREAGITPRRAPRSPGIEIRSRGLL